MASKWPLEPFQIIREKVQWVFRLDPRYLGLALMDGAVGVYSRPEFGFPDSSSRLLCQYG